MRCLYLVGRSFAQCAKERHLFGQCVDEWGNVGRITQTRAEKRRDREAVYRAKAYAAQLFRPRGTR